MLIQYISAEDEDDCRSAFSIFVDGERLFKFVDGEPEDNNLARNFNDILKIHELVEKTKEACKNGEEIEVEDLELSWSDFRNFGKKQKNKN